MYNSDFRLFVCNYILLCSLYLCFHFCRQIITGRQLSQVWSGLCCTCCWRKSLNELLTFWMVNIVMVFLVWTPYDPSSDRDLTPYDPSAERDLRRRSLQFSAKAETVLGILLKIYAVLDQIHFVRFWQSSMSFPSWNITKTSSTSIYIQW